MQAAYVKISASRRALCFYFLLSAFCFGFITGCTESTSEIHGPTSPSPVRVGIWDRGNPNSRCVATPHYQIFTDITDAESQQQIAQLMEGAYTQYLTYLPTPPASQPPMRCFVFSRRAEWAAFTQQHAGKDAAVYLQINRGAYTIDDWFVAFWIGDSGTLAVMAHEGWHQFVARNCRGRLPPTLEEGLACTFENIHWSGPLPRWNLHEAPGRTAALSAAMHENRLWSLSQLLRLHAGDIISLPRQSIDTYYAQAWALALFLSDPDRPYYQQFQAYLADVAAGTAFRPGKFSHLKVNDWHPDLSAPQLEHYLGRSLPSIESEFRDYCRKLANRAPSNDS
jgi:hypothetical protein